MSENYLLYASIKQHECIDRTIYSFLTGICPLIFISSSHQEQERLCSIPLAVPHH